MEGKFFRFEEGQEQFTIREFYNQYQHVLPKVVIVSEGCYGEIEMETFCTDQVMYIHTCTRQKRVIARDIKSRTLSIPLNYPMKFRVVESRKKVGKEQYIADIMKTQKLPVQIQFAAPDGASFYVGGEVAKVKSFGNLLVSEVYDETYLLANCINDGILDKKVVIVPLYLKDMQIALTTGIAGMSSDEWKKYLEKTKDDMTRITVDKNVGHNDIGVYTGVPASDSENVYDYIQPTFLTFTETPTEDDDTYDVIQDDKCKTDRMKGLSGRSRKPQLPERTPVQKAVTSKPEGDYSPAHKYINNIARAEVAPISFKRTLNPKKPKDSHKSVTDLTIEEVGGRLKQLKLEKYVKTFKEQQIDGLIVSEFDENILKQDFRFSTVEAIKLMKFIQSGHIPH